MNIGTITQSIATATALVLGIRAELRASRTRTKERAVAVAQLLAILSRAAEILPRRFDANLHSSIGHNRKATIQLAGKCRESIEAVAAVFPSSAAELLDLADRLEDISAWPEAFLESEESNKEVLDTDSAVYHFLQLLSIPVSTRITFKGDVVTDPKPKN